MPLVTHVKGRGEGNFHFALRVVSASEKGSPTLRQRPVAASSHGNSGQCKCDVVVSLYHVPSSAAPSPIVRTASSMSLMCSASICFDVSSSKISISKSYENSGRTVGTGPCEVGRRAVEMGVESLCS